MDRAREVMAKIEQVKDWLGRSGWGGIVFESSANFGWITAGGDSSVVLSEERGVASVLVTPRRATILTPNNEHRRLVEEEVPAGSFEIVEYPWFSPERREELIAGLAGTGKVAGDLPSKARPTAGPELAELRRVLVEPEIERYRRLGEEAAFAVESACRSVEPKERELDAAARVAALCRERNIHAVVNLAAADERIARYRHPLPTAKRAARTMMLALTARSRGLHVSLTRTVTFGEPDPEQEAGHSACARIDACMISRSRPGVRLSEVLQAAAVQYEAEGYPDEWRRHHQGGVTGYAGREVFATPDAGYPLKAGQALAWNPSVPGAKSEDTVVVTYHGVEVITASGHWPLLNVETDGTVTDRPALLIR